MSILPPPADSVLLLRDVRELGVESQPTHHERLPLVGDVAHGLGGCRATTPPSGAREPAHALDDLHQPLALLLDEHGAEDRSEQPDVAAELRTCSPPAGGALALDLDFHERKARPSATRDARRGDGATRRRRRPRRAPAAAIRSRAPAAHTAFPRRARRPEEFRARRSRPACAGPCRARSTLRRSARPDAGP